MVRKVLERDGLPAQPAHFAFALDLPGGLRRIVVISRLLFFVLLLLDGGQRRRRPERWWGVLGLWEFWLAVFFAGAFVWSVAADRRRLRRRPAAAAGRR